jgi:glycosyltransferase involved in cell wall biosynthesis
MAAGIPLVCADIGVARELCGDIPYYFPSDNESGFVEALELAVTDANKKSRLRAGVEHAKIFSWQREAQETMEILRRAGSTN